MTPFFKLISLFTPDERRRLIPIMLGTLFASVLEMAGIGSLGPFMAVVADPAIVQRQPVLAALYQFCGFRSEREFLIVLGILVFVLVLLATSFKMLVLYVMYRFTGRRRYSLGLRLFRQYLYQPYRFFLNHNSGELSTKILSEVDMVIAYVLLPSMDIVIRGVLILSVLVFLVILNPLVAVAALGVFGVIYLGLYAVVRSKLSRYGKDVTASNLIRYKTANEAFGGIKDVKILGKEAFFVRSYHIGAERFSMSQTASQILSSIPNQAMQALAVGFAVALVIILLGVNGSLSAILPLLAIYAFAIMRMMPNIQAFFTDATQIRYYSHVADTLYHDITVLPSPPMVSGVEDSPVAFTPLSFTREIILDKVVFSYPASQEPVLKGIDLRVNKDMTLGLVGATGCGKTTLVDVIMGLLEPSGGSIIADDVSVTDTANTAAWQRNFGYVPQQIYLSDDTVAANIAFGIPEDLRDMGSVEQAARIANMHKFIAAELPRGYDTVVGERGIRLSGGQRQRIGIARALYHDPSILVMDEATSSLDSITEDAVMDAIHNLMHSKTIIIIAHRLSTVRECDQICLMEKGRIVAQGSYGELIKTNVRFRAMAKIV
jgi:ABC-type multidrug transport system fused ATPase/permease subunit